MKEEADMKKKTKMIAGALALLLASCTALADTSQEVFADQYFRVIARLEQGTAGSSLKLAQTAAQIADFASGELIQNQDKDALRETLLAGWESLTEEERMAFDQNFMEVVELLDRSAEDWPQHAGLFEDAGVREKAEAILSDPEKLLSWETLLGFTLTMGNAEAVPSEDTGSNAMQYSE